MPTTATEPATPLTDSAGLEATEAKLNVRIGPPQVHSAMVPGSPRPVTFARTSGGAATSQARV
jgi:hypothetical protein